MQTIEAPPDQSVDDRLLLTEAMPLMVEAGALLDLIAGIFVMGLIIKQISREFSSIDTSRMTALREVE